MTKYLNAYKKSYNFSGYSSRSEYWSFMFVWFAIQIFLVILSTSTPRDGLNTFAFVTYIIFYFGSIIPSIAISVRRHHDAGWSGWWYLISIWSLILMFFPSKKIGNKYRPETLNLLVPEVASETVAIPITSSLESEQIVNDIQLSEKNILVSKKKTIIVISLILCTALVISLLIDHFNKKVSPSSVAAAMHEWCDKDSLNPMIGVEAVQIFYSEIHAQSSTAALSCSQGNVVVNVLFFQTSYDENIFLSYFQGDLIWIGNSAKEYTSPVNLSISKGIVAWYAWPKNHPSTTEGLVREWMKDTFGVLPSPEHNADQVWKGTLPPITYKTFGEKGPGSGPAVIN